MDFFDVTVIAIGYWLEVSLDPPPSLRDTSASGRHEKVTSAIMTQPPAGDRLPGRNSDEYRMHRAGGSQQSRAKKAAWYQPQQMRGTGLPVAKSTTLSPPMEVFRIKCQ